MWIMRKRKPAFGRWDFQMVQILIRDGCQETPGCYERGAVINTIGILGAMPKVESAAVLRCQNVALHTGNGTWRCVTLPSAVCTMLGSDWGWPPRARRTYPNGRPASCSVETRLQPLVPIQHRERPCHRPRQAYRSPAMGSGAHPNPWF